MTSVEAPVHVYTEAHRAESGTRSKSVRFFFSFLFFLFSFFLSSFLPLLSPLTIEVGRRKIERLRKIARRISLITRRKRYRRDARKVENFYLEGRKVEEGE